MSGIEGSLEQVKALHRGRVKVWHDDACQPGGAVQGPVGAVQGTRHAALLPAVVVSVRSARITHNKTCDWEREGKRTISRNQDDGKNTSF